MTTEILKRLTKMADRLEFSSHQAILVYAANLNWTSAEMSEVAITILEKLAASKGIELNGEEPFLIQLIKHKVFLPEEVEVFGYKIVTKNPGADARPANGDKPTVVHKRHGNGKDRPHV